MDQLNISGNAVGNETNLSPPMIDLEMTKLCAEAVRLHVVCHPIRGTIMRYWFMDANVERTYDPLHDDAQCMALVKTLGLTVDPQEDKPPFTWRVVVADDGDWDKQIFSQGSDLNRAIVECVAKMFSSSQGKPMIGRGRHSTRQANLHGALSRITERLLPRMMECESCGGSGKIWDEGETPKMDNWRQCLDCTGTGQIPAK